VPAATANFASGEMRTELRDFTTRRVAALMALKKEAVERVPSSEEDL